MKITVLCNCGVFLQTNNAALLVDALNSNFDPFFELPDEEYGKMLRAEPPYDVPLGIAFTHLHPDHYCESKLKMLLQARKDVQVLMPTAFDRKETILNGAFCVETYAIAHTPAPGYDDVVHNSLYICADTSTYITSDAICDVKLHEKFLSGRKADVSFWNPQYLSYPQTRKLIEDASVRTVIYHTPLDEKDVSGIRTKAVHSIERFADELHSTDLILSYPCYV